MHLVTKWCVSVVFESIFESQFTKSKTKPDMTAEAVAPRGGA